MTSEPLTKKINSLFYKKYLPVIALVTFSVFLLVLLLIPSSTSSVVNKGTINQVSEVSANEVNITNIKKGKFIIGTTKDEDGNIWVMYDDSTKSKIGKMGDVLIDIKYEVKTNTLIIVYKDRATTLELPNAVVDIKIKDGDMFIKYANGKEDKYTLNLSRSIIDISVTSPSSLRVQFNDGSIRDLNLNKVE